MSGGTAPRILNLGDKLRWVVSFTSRQLYLQRTAPPVPIGYESMWAPELAWIR